MNIKLIPIKDNSNNSFISLTIHSAHANDSHTKVDKIIHELYPSFVANKPITGVEAIFAKNITEDTKDIIPWIRLYDELSSESDRAIYGESIKLQPTDLVQIAYAYERYVTEDYGSLITHETIKPFVKLISAISDPNYVVFLTYHKN